MPQHNTVGEFLEKVGKCKRTQEKVEALRANDSLVLRVSLQAIYDPAVVFDLPEGDPPYKENDPIDIEHVYITEARRVQYFIKDIHPDLKPAKREQMFIEMLENIHPYDAKLLLKMKNKEPIKGITKEHVMEALPGLIPT